MTISDVDVQNYLDSNQGYAESYFLKHATLTWVNKWLLQNGYSAITDKLAQSQLSSRSCSQLCADWQSTEVNSRRSRTPDLRRTKSGRPDLQQVPVRQRQNSTEPPNLLSVTKQGTFSFLDRNGSFHSRPGSRKHLRSDFARSKSKSIFRTYEPSTDSEHANKLAERRNSLKYMRQCTSLPSTSGTMLSLLIQSNVSLPRYASKDEFYKRDLRQTSEKDFFLEIVKDISHDLDIKSLTRMILLNITILMEAEKSSLFFVEGPRGKRTPVSTAPRVVPDNQETKGENKPWDQAVINHVAKSGETVNISKEAQHEIDSANMLEEAVDSLLCMAIYNSDHDVIGVVQTVNKQNQTGFTDDDEKLLEMYLAFCGLAISNAQAIEAYTKEYDRNKALLEVVHELFEEQTTVEKIVTKLMRRAQSLLKCERCVVMLRDNSDPQSTKEEYNRVFDMQATTKNNMEKDAKNVEFKQYRLENGNNLASTFQRDAQNCFHRSNVLCKPIRDNECKTLGIAQLINKENDEYFDEHDNQFFEAFCIFCGLGIKNCLLYDEVSHAAARQAVALEVIAYHATVPLEDVFKFKIPSAEVSNCNGISQAFCLQEKQVPECSRWKLDQMDFNDFSLPSEDMVIAAIRIFKDSGLMAYFKIDYETLVRWLLTVRKNYRNVAYHNWRHAFNVCQAMFVCLNTCGMRQQLSMLECLALLVACLCHDLDHRGTNNAFQQKCSTPLAQLYGTQATLEQHHFNHAVIILNSEGHNIFSSLSRGEYAEVMNVLKHAILATDISKHIQVRQKFFPLVESKLYNWSDKEQRDLLISIMMTSCDIATITKPWHIQRKAADLVVTEFFNQGDKEKILLKLQPIALMDREKQDELPKLQIQWIDGICYPLYKSLSELDESFKPMLTRLRENRDHWEILDRKRLDSIENCHSELVILETDV